MRWFSVPTAIHGTVLMKRITTAANVGAVFLRKPTVLSPASNIQGAPILHKPQLVVPVLDIEEYYQRRLSEDDFVQGLRYVADPDVDYIAGDVQTGTKWAEAFGTAANAIGVIGNWDGASMHERSASMWFL